MINAFLRKIFFGTLRAAELEVNVALCLHINDSRSRTYRSDTFVGVSRDLMSVLLTSAALGGKSVVRSD